MQNSVRLQELAKEGVNKLGTKIVSKTGTGPTSTIENIIEKKRATAIKVEISEEILNPAFPVRKRGKDEKMY